MIANSEYVKETMNCRYSWRAAVMSRNEGENEKKELLVWMVFWHLIAYSLSRVTVVREGMSVCEDGVIGSTLQSDGARILKRVTVFNSSE